MDYEAAPDHALGPETRKRMDEALAALAEKCPFLMALADQHVIGGVGPYGNTLLRDDGALLVDPDFVQELSLADLGFELAVKALYRHSQAFERVGDRDFMLWNLALQHEVVDVLARSGLQVPTILLEEKLYHPDLTDTDAEELYQEMPRRIPALRRAERQAAEAAVVEVSASDVLSARDPAVEVSAGAVKSAEDPAPSITGDPGTKFEADVQMLSADAVWQEALRRSDFEIPEALAEWKARRERMKPSRTADEDVARGPSRAP